MDVAAQLAALHDGHRGLATAALASGLRCSAGRELPRGVRAARRGVGWLPDATRRWRRCSLAVSSPAEAATQQCVPGGRAGVTFLISVGISIVGEELSGPTRRRRGRRDASCFASVLQAR